jgi:outer membrane protein TolC
MKKIICLYVLLAASVPVKAKTDLTTAIRVGIKRDLMVKNWRLEEKANLLEKRNAEARRWFTLDLGATYYFVSEQMRIRFPSNDLGNGIVIPGTDMTVGAKHNYDAHLSLSQPLFTGGLLANSIKSRTTQLEMARENARLQALETAARIKQSYFTHRLLVHRREAITAFMQTLSLHLDKLHQWYAEELVRRSDVLETESRLQEQKLLLEEVSDLIEREKITFMDLCGIDLDDMDPDQTESIPDLDTAMTELRSHHPVLKILTNRLSLLDINKRTVNGAYLPQVQGFAELHYARPGVDFFTNEWMFYFRGGFGLSMKVFDWGQRKRDEGIIEYHQEKIVNQMTDFIREGDTALRQLYSSKAAAEAKLRLIRRLSKIAEEESQLKYTLFLEKQLSNIDYLAALTSRDRTRWREKELLSQMELIKTHIRRVIGRDHHLAEEEK